MALSDTQKRENALARFFQKSQINGKTHCWIWNRRCTPKGYPQFFDGFRMVRAHRYSYEIYHGPIPSDKEIDHTCRNRACVNPAHLEVVTHQENIARAVWNRGKSHCRHGHEYTLENTYHDPKGKRTRGCKACRKAASDRQLAKRERRPRGLQGCALTGCSSKHYSRGFCQLHYQRMNRGLPLEAPFGIGNSRWA